jgi:lambda repressor-like predicted transcriptional regulator
MESLEPQPNLANIIIGALKAKGVNLARLSEATGVPEGILATLLEEKYDKLPPAPYVRGYILKIAEVLNLNGQNLWVEYLKNQINIKRPGPADVLPPNRFKTSRVKKMTIAIIAGVVIIFGYIILRLPGFLGTPSFGLAPLPATVTSPNLTIQGKMNPADQLMLNGEEIYPDKSGNFRKDILLQPGFNTLTFDVKKLMGQTYVVTKQVFYNAPTSTNTTSIIH